MARRYRSDLTALTGSTARSASSRAKRRDTLPSWEVRRHLSRLEPLREVLRPVRDDDVGAGSDDRGQRLERALALVDVALLRRGADERVLAGDVVGGDREVESAARRPDHVEVGKRRLDHDRVGALGDVELALAHRLADVRGVHLVAAAVAERGSRVGGLAERTVER